MEASKAFAASNASYQGRKFKTSAMPYIFHKPPKTRSTETTNQFDFRTNKLINSDLFNFDFSLTLRFMIS